MKNSKLSTNFAATSAAIGYSLCSSTLLLLNKTALQYLPSGSLLSIIQFLIASFIILWIQFLQFDRVDHLECSKMIAYGKYVMLFVCTIYSNMKSLTMVNVETVIVFRSCTPLAVSIIEYLLLNRQLPSIKSFLALLGVCFGAIVYCCSDSQFTTGGIQTYTWVLIYFVLITTEMTYGKVIISSVKMESVWGSVFYCSVLSLPFFCGAEVLQGDLIHRLATLQEINWQGWSIIFLSSIFATLIGYNGWLCRSLVSATTYTLIGVANKFLTILLNVWLFGSHTSRFGLFAVCLCLACSSLYEQAPMRNNLKKTS